MSEAMSAGECGSAVFFCLPPFQIHSVLPRSHFAPPILAESLWLILPESVVKLSVRCMSAFLTSPIRNTASVLCLRHSVSRDSHFKP